MSYQTMADEIFEMLGKEAVNFRCPDYNSDCSDYIERVDRGRQQMKWDNALDLCKRGSALCSGLSIDAAYCQAIAEMYSGAVYHSMGDLEEARSCYHQSTDIFSIMERDDSQWSEAVARYALGLLAQSTGDLDRAQELYRQSYRLFQRLGKKADSPRHRVGERMRHLDFLREQKQQAQEQADSVPIIGTTAAGEPILAIEVKPEEMFWDRIRLRDRNCRIKRVLEIGKGPTLEIETANTHFALGVKGKSMTGIGIEDGDYVIFRRQPVVEQNEIAVVRIDDLPQSTSTVKRFYQQGMTIYLKPENPEYPIQIFRGGDPTITILGKAVAVVSVLE